MRSIHCRKLAFPFCALIASSGAAAQCLDKLLPLDPHQSGAFGISVALHDDRALIGALAHGAPNPAGTLSPLSDGTAYVFELGLTGWVQTAQLFPDAPLGSLEYFGLATAIHGDFAFVGAPGDTAHGSDSGAVHVYERGAAGWQQVAKLAGQDTIHGDRFGLLLASDGARLAVATQFANTYAPTGELSSQPNGAVYVFERAGTAWVQAAEFEAPPGSGSETYACSVAVSGNRLAVGARLADGATSSTGAVYMYELVAGGWVFETRLTAADGTNGDYFGTAVALDHERLLVGASLDSASATTSGSVYVFERGPSGWAQTAKLHGLGLTANEQLGWSIALDGERAIVGTNDFIASNGGSAHVFEHRPEGWFELERPQPDGANGALFAQAVALSGDIALVGSRYDDSVAHNSGAVFSFGLPAVSSIAASTQQISAASGGAQVLQLDAGCSFAGKVYLTLGSLSGYAPGLDMKPLIVPLNPDPYFFLTLQAPNHAPLSGSLGVLDAQGRGTTAISIAPGSVANLVGLTGWHAFGVVLFEPYAFVAFTSAPQRLDIAP